MRYLGRLNILLGCPRSRAPLGRRAARAAKNCCPNLALRRAHPSALNLGCPLSKSGGILIARYSHQASLPHLLPLSMLLSTVPLVFGYFCMKNGYKLFPTTQRWASYANSSLILPRQILPLSTWWTTLKATSPPIADIHWKWNVIL